jgi:Rrf2 family protein
MQLKIIARNQNISVKYLEQLMTTLKAAGLVRSLRGAKGGYMLAKATKQIKLSDVFSALEGPSAITVECLDDDNYCARTADCVTRQVWAQVQDAVMGVLESLTLQDLVNSTKEKRSSDYQI